MRFLISVLCLVLVLSSNAFASGENLKIAGMTVTVWEPHTAGKVPVIIFSHGFHGCSTQSTFLMEAFADASYIVFAPNHSDATCNGGTSHRFLRPEKSFAKPEQWDETQFSSRRDDMRNLIAALKSDSRFKDRIDWQRLGLAGHSLGGYTVLAMGGAIKSWKTGGVSAILAMSPYSTPLIAHLNNLSAPVMYQGGSRDFGITPYVKKTGGAYDSSPAPKYFVEFDGAGHLAWTDIFSTHHALISAYSVAFMDYYLKDQPAPQLTKRMQGVADLRAMEKPEK